MVLFTSEESAWICKKFRKALESTAACREREKKRSWIHQLRYKTCWYYLEKKKKNSSRLLSCYFPTSTHTPTHTQRLLPWPLSVPRSTLCGSACVTSPLVHRHCLMTLHLLRRPGRRGDKISEIRNRKISSFYTGVEKFSHDGLLLWRKCPWSHKITPN